jgi:hypothetical protein
MTSSGQVQPPKPAPSAETSMTSSESVQVPRPQWWKFWRWSPEIILAIATLILAGIAGIQAYILATTDTSTRKVADAASKAANVAEIALRTARDNFRTEQRPIVWLTNNPGSPEFMPNQQKADGTGRIIWSWHFTNYGKTPALHLSFRHFMTIENSSEQSYGSVSPFASAPLPTSKDDFATVISRPGFSADQFTKLMETNGIGISGEITYSDVYGESYVTTFCLRHLPHAIGYCKEGNDIK